MVKKTTDTRKICRKFISKQQDKVDAVFHSQYEIHRESVEKGWIEQVVSMRRAFSRHSIASSSFPFSTYNSPSAAHASWHVASPSNAARKCRSASGKHSSARWIRPMATWDGAYHGLTARASSKYRRASSDDDAPPPPWRRLCRMIAPWRWCMRWDEGPILAASARHSNAESLCSRDM